MRVVFQIYASLPEGISPRLIYAALEDCHPDNVEYRAKVLLLALSIDEHPDLVKVVRFDDGTVLYERSIAAKR